MPEPRALHPPSQPPQPTANPSPQFPKQGTLVEASSPRRSSSRLFSNRDNPWKTGPKTTEILSRIKAIAMDAEAGGRYAKEIAPHLARREKIIMEKMILPSPPLTLPEMLKGTSVRNLSSTLHCIGYNMLKKLERWQKGEPIPLKPVPKSFPYKSADKSKKLIEDRMASGETLKKIKRSLKSGRTESMLIDLYVLPSKRPAQQQVAEEIGVSKAAVMASLGTLSYKLRGLTHSDKYAAGCQGMSDDEIREAIISCGAKTRTELRHMHLGLAFVAKERGITGQVFENKKGKCLLKLEELLKKRLEKDSLGEILSGLSPMEREIILRRVLPATPALPSDLPKLRRAAPSEAYKLESGLAAKLWSRRQSISSAAKELIKKLGKKKLRELRAALRAEEIAVLERRTLSPKPETLESLGRSFAISREGVRMMEKNLLRKIAAFSERGITALRRKACRTRRLLKLRGKAGAMGEGQLGEFRATLSELELAILERRALSIFPQTRLSIATNLSVSLSKIANAEKKLLEKCAQREGISLP